MLGAGRQILVAATGRRRLRDPRSRRGRRLSPPRMPIAIELLPVPAMGSGPAARRRRSGRRAARAVDRALSRPRGRRRSATAPRPGPTRTLVAPGAAIGAPPDLAQPRRARIGAWRRSTRWRCAAAPSRRSSPRCAPICAMPASCGSTMSWGCSGSTGSRAAPATAQGAYVDLSVRRSAAPRRARKPARSAAPSSARISARCRRASARRCATANVLSYRVLRVRARAATAASCRRSDYPRAGGRVGLRRTIWRRCKGFWLGRDIDWRRRLGLYPDDAAIADRGRRSGAAIAGCCSKRCAGEGLLAAERGRRVAAATTTSRSYAPELGEAVHRLPRPLARAARAGAARGCARRRRAGQSAGHQSTSIRTGGAAVAARLEESLRDRCCMRALAAVLDGGAAASRRRMTDADRRHAASRATYRLQFHSDFTFRDAEALVDLSRRARHQPRLCLAVPGGAAGLDARLRHHRSQPAQSGDRQRGRNSRALVATLQAHGMGLILDFVPNHMGVGGADNAWWLDVLEWGEASPYADLFRHQLGSRNAPICSGKVLLPVLGDQYGVVLEKRRDRAALRCRGGQLQRLVLRASLPDLAALLCGDPARRRRAGRRCERRTARTSPTASRGWSGRRRARAARASMPKARSSRRRWPSWRARAGGAGGARAGGGELRSASRASRRAGAGCTSCSRRRPIASPIGASPPTRSTTAASSTSTISPACASSCPSCSSATHRLVFDAGRRERRSQGLRIDHIDGLFDPAGYCERLQREASTARRPDGSFYVVVEKILARYERCRTGRSPAPPAMTSSDQVGGLFVDADGEAAMTRALSPLHRPRRELRRGALRRQEAHHRTSISRAR